MILNEYVDVTINKSNARHYEELGYHIEKEKDDRGRDRIKCGQIIRVKVSDLPPSSNVLIDVECDYCHKKFKRRYGNINKFNKIITKDSCKSCSWKKSHEVEMKIYNTTNTSAIAKINNSIDGRPNKYSWDNVINKCKERNYIFCDDNNTDVKCICKTKINYICNKHKECGKQTTTVESMMDKNKHFLCKFCRKEIISNKQRTSSIEEVFEIAKNKNYKILTEKINSVDDTIEYICNEHKEYGVQKTTLYGLRKYKNNCRMCKIPKKEAHWHWNGGISNERDIFKNTIEYRRWRKNVFERDNYTCQCCGKKGGN